MSDLIECIVAPGRTVFAGPPNADGTVSTGSQPGQTVRVTREDAAVLRASGHLLHADGSPAVATSSGPMPADSDAR